MMRRRLASAGLGATLLWVGTRAAGQAGERVWRVGILRPGEPPRVSDDPQVTGVPRALRELGYSEGRNLTLETRYAQGDLSRLPALAGSFVADGFDVVVAVGSPAVRAMKQASSTVPIIMYGNFDPVALGLVASLARPGANVTGVLIAPDGTLAAKRLQLLKELVPQATRIGLLVPEDDSIRLQVQETLKAARALRVELPVVSVRGGDYAAAFDALVRQRAGALVVGSHQYFVRDRAPIIELAARYRLPAMYEWREQVADGGLMSYSTSLYGVHQRVAAYVDRIVKGARPAEMPVDRPTRFDLVINLRTARALGLSISQSFLLRADEVIE
jgi:putative tryptophan/tyrosine transport system substrate-binding protein